MSELSEQIKILEERLLHSDLKQNPQLLDEMLADEFEEIGPSGQITDRQAAVEWLIAKDPAARWLLEGFKATKLSDSLMLVIYQAQQVEPERSKSKGSLRASIWRKQSDSGCWQMVFHQATKIL